MKSKIEITLSCGSTLNVEYDYNHEKNDGYNLPDFEDFEIIDITSNDILNMLLCNTKTSDIYSEILIKVKDKHDKEI